MGMKAFKYRLYPTASQKRQLLHQLAVTRSWYNMCLGERKVMWEYEQQPIGKYEQLSHVKHFKKTFRQASDVHSHALQVATADLDEAFKAFFRRVKSGETPGFPRFKGYQRWHSFGFKEYGNGFKLDGRRLRVFGVGRIRVRWHRPVEGKIKTCRILHKAGRWDVAFACEVPDSEPLPEMSRTVGIDVGISALITSSDGQKIDNPQFYRNSQRRLRVLQRKLARANRGSQNRRKALLAVQRQQEHVANQRKDYLNKLIHNLVEQYDLIAVEDLRIRNMVRNKHLSKSILDSGWYFFRERLTRKAAEAGREVIFVDPAYTSKTCSNCGAPFEDLTLADRWVECGCGLSLDRDHNAAINILNRAGRARESERKELSYA